MALNEKEMAMNINCDECVMQHTDACGDCVVTFLLREGEGPVRIGTDERVALGEMAAVGLLPPLRLVRGEAATG